jgi:hypothetical protein
VRHRGAIRVDAPAQVLDTLAEIHHVLRKHPCPVERLEPLCAKIGPQVDWFIKHKVPAFQTTQRWYMHVLTCHIVDMAKAQAKRGLSPAITSSSFVEAGHKITKPMLLSLPGGGNPRASELAKNPLVMCFKEGRWSSGRQATSGSSGPREWEEAQALWVTLSAVDSRRRRACGHPALLEPRRAVAQLMAARNDIRTRAAASGVRYSLYYYCLGQAQC